MSRFRIIVAVAIFAVGIAMSGWLSDPPLPPEPPHRIVRGPQSLDRDYEAWLDAVKARQAGLTATAVTFDTDTLVFVGSIVGLTTGVLALLSKYVIAPMISKQLAETMKQIDEKYVRRETIEEHLKLDEERHDAILLQLGQIWEKVK